MPESTAGGRHAVRRLPGGLRAHLLGLIILTLLVLVGPTLILLVKSLPS